MNVKDDPQGGYAVQLGDYILKIEAYRLLQGGNRREWGGRARDGPPLCTDWVESK